MLTGKCKEDFVKWFGEDDEYNMDLESNLSGYNPVTGFKDLPFSMQFGVYVDFFDIVGIDIEIQVEIEPKVYYPTVNGEYVHTTFYYSRQKSRQKAIEKANEIYNQNQGQ